MIVGTQTKHLVITVDKDGGVYMRMPNMNTVSDDLTVVLRTAPPQESPLSLSPQTRNVVLHSYFCDLTGWFSKLSDCDCVGPQQLLCFIPAFPHDT